MAGGEELVVNPMYTPDRQGPRGERQILSAALRKIIEQDEGRIAVELAKALIAAGSLPDERCVGAQKLIYDRVEGPVERVLKHHLDGEMTQKRLVIDPALLPERDLIERGVPAIAITSNGHSNGHHKNGHSNGHHTNGNGNGKG